MSKTFMLYCVGFVVVLLIPCIWWNLFLLYGGLVVVLFGPLLGGAIRKKATQQERVICGALLLALILVSLFEIALLFRT